MSSPVTIVKRKSTLPRKLAIVFVCLLLLAGIASIGISIYVGWSLTHPAKEALEGSPTDYGLSYEEAEFTSLEGDIALKGWYIPAPEQSNPMTLVVAHGYQHNREFKQVDSLDLAKRLIARGYNVLLFDFRNSGESGGNMTSVGEFEKYDLLAAIDWVQVNHPSKIGLIGFSMGASTALLAAADDADVLGVVADSPFSDLHDYLQQNLPVWSHLPDFPFTPLILNLLPPITGMDVDQASPISVLDEIYPRPVLFIHSDTDTSIPYTESEKMADTHPDQFIFWQTTGADHVGTYQLNPDTYIDHVDRFFAALH